MSNCQHDNHDSFNEWGKCQSCGIRYEDVCLQCEAKDAEIERLQKLILDGDTTVGGARAALWRENAKLQAVVDALKGRRDWINNDVSYKAPEQITVALFAEYLEMLFGELAALDD